MRTKKRKKCNMTGKLQFNSERDAERVVLLTQQIRGDKGARRIYYCNHCSFFHLTNKTNDDSWRKKNTYEEKELKYKKEWSNLLKYANDEIATLEKTTAIQAHKRHEKGPVAGIPGYTVITLFDRLCFEIPGRCIDVAQGEQLPCDPVGGGRTRADNAARPSRKQRDQMRAVLRTGHEQSTDGYMFRADFGIEETVLEPAAHAQGM